MKSLIGEGTAGFARGRVARCRNFKPLIATAVRGFFYAQKTSQEMKGVTGGHAMAPRFTRSPLEGARPTRRKGTGHLAAQPAPHGRRATSRFAAPQKRGRGGEGLVVEDGVFDFGEDALEGV